MNDGNITMMVRMVEQGDVTIDPIEIFDERARAAFRPDSQLERLATGATWSEGPVWVDRQSLLVWSDIPANRMLCWSADAGIRVFRFACGFTNGNTLDHDGRMITCSHGRRAIERTDRDGNTEILVDRYDGKRLNSPNDVVVKSDGSIWFTDPPYGIVSDHEGYAAPSEQDGNHVYRFDPATRAITIVTREIEEPNGLAFSPDERTLYVSDTSAALRDDGTGNHHIMAFDVIDGQHLSEPRLFAVIAPGLPDGFRIDSRGWIFTSSADAIQLYHPDGTRMARIPVPEKVSNCTFGGPTGDELFITASTSLYRIRLAAHTAVGLVLETAS